jgi:hypothetical protein
MPSTPKIGLDASAIRTARDRNGRTGDPNPNRAAPFTVFHHFGNGLLDAP